MSGKPFYGHWTQFYRRFYSAGRSYCLVFWVLSLFQSYTLRRAYADLPTVLTIVHFDGTHPIPP